MTAKKITARGLVLGIWALSAIAVLLAVNQSISPWLTFPFVLPVIVVLPGLMALMALKIRTSTRVEYALYAIGTSLAFWTLGGLMINETLPQLGVAAPLSAVPVAVAFGVTITLLGLAIIIRRPDFSLVINTHVPHPQLLTAVIPSALIVMSIMGANTLNNGGSGALSILLLFCIAAYIIAVVVLRRTVQAWQYTYPIFAIALSLIFMYSLRSWHILGWDINGEFSVFQTTLAHHYWSMRFFPSQPYNACLSVTILPTILQDFTHVSSEYVFKVVAQILFAITPVIIYSFSARYIRPVWAFLAAMIFVSQTWFYQQMPALVRQEMAFLFFALMILTIFDRNLAPRHQFALFALVTSSLVVSHYSTAYICVILLLCASLLSMGVRRFWPGVAGGASRPSALAARKVILSLLILIVWQGAVTHTLGSARAFVTGAASSAHEVFSSTAIMNGVEGVALGSPGESTTKNLEFVYGLALKRSRGYANDLYPSGSYRGYVPHAQSDTRILPARLPHLVSSSVRWLAIAAKATLTYVLTLLGTVLIFMSLRKKRPPIGLEYCTLSIAAVVLVGAFVFVPYFQSQYGFTRLYLQAMVILSFVAVVGLSFVLRKLPRANYFAASILVAFCMLFLTGAFNHIIGGPMPITTVQQSRALDRFYTDEQEIFGARWLERFRNRHEPVYADSISRLRLQAYANLDANPDVFPATIRRDSYVYLGLANARGGYGFYHYYNTTIVSRFPRAFLNAHKDIIYTNGDSLIYR